MEPQVIVPEQVRDVTIQPQGKGKEGKGETGRNLQSCRVMWKQWNSYSDNNKQLTALNSSQVLQAHATLLKRNTEICTLNLHTSTQLESRTLVRQTRLFGNNTSLLEKQRCMRHHTHTERSIWSREHHDIHMILCNLYQKMNGFMNLLILGEFNLIRNERGEDERFNRMITSNIKLK